MKGYRLIWHPGITQRLPLQFGEGWGEVKLRQVRSVFLCVQKTLNT